LFWQTQHLSLEVQFQLLVHLSGGLVSH
jgi:hypothetical protein